MIYLMIPERFLPCVYHEAKKLMPQVVSRSLIMDSVHRMGAVARLVENDELNSYSSSLSIGGSGLLLARISDYRTCACCGVADMKATDSKVRSFVRMASESTKLYCCSCCRCVYYCGRRCQREHWHIHKAVCEALLMPLP